MARILVDPEDRLRTESRQTLSKRAILFGLTEQAAEDSLNPDVAGRNSD